MLPAAFDQYLQFRSQRIRASIEREKAWLKIEEKLRTKEREENRAYWRAKLKALPAYPPESYPLTAIPSCRRKIVNLPEKRRRRFRDLLNRTLSEAITERLHQPPTATEMLDPVATDSTLNPIITKTCTFCAGGCCTRGGGHAYLNKNTLLRVMNQRPELRPRHIFDTYLDNISAKTYALQRST